MADYRLHQTGDEIQRILDNATPQSDLTAETERAQQAEQQLQQNINNEQSERQQADTTLQQHIDAEAQTRQQADAALQQLIQQVQASLINYYLKTETYSANEINQMLSAIKQFRYQVVDSLPEPSADTMGIIYLVPSAHAVSGNIKDEYITLTRDEGSGIIYYFEQIGETAIDLSNYYTKAQTNAEITNALNTALANYSTTQQMNTAIANAIAAYYTKAQVDAMIAPFITASVNNLVNYYLKSETFNKTEVQQMIAAVKQFRYQVVAELPTASADTVGIIYLIPSTNPKTKNTKDEFITISITEQGSTTYSWEQIGSTEVDLSGYSTTEQMNAAISSAITAALAPYYTAEQVNAAISTALSDYYTSQQTDAAITSALNAALASYSTTQQMNAAIATAIANYYTKAQVDALIANFITASVNNLVNYYLKSETYSKDEVNQLIGELSSLRFEVADSLPDPSASTLGAIYLVPGSSPTVQNIKDEYITLKRTEGGVDTYYWELIGSTAVDLSNYYTKDQTNAAITAALNAALADYSTTQQMNAAIATAIANYYTKQEVDALIADFITASVNNLVNYYLKSETYTKAEVQQLIAAIKQFTYQSVAVLPTASADTMNIIYLVPSDDPKTQNVKDEYITISATDQGTTTYSWEQIGSTEIDLSGYYTSQQTDAAISTALASYYTKTQTDTAITTALNTALADYSTSQQMNAAIATAIAGYYTKQEVDALIVNFITKSVDDLVNYYLKSDTYTKSEVQQLIAAVKQFTYQSVATLPTASADTMNKIYLVPSTNPKTKNVKDEFITISATDQGTTTYSWEQIGSTEIDLSGYYTSQQTDAAISTALASYYTKTQTDTAITTALNTALADYSTSQQMNAAIATAIAGYYTKQEVDALIVNFITKSVDDLVNYYLKSDTYTKSEVQQLIAAVKQFTYQSVATLPTASAETMNIIYLVPSSDPKTQNVKDEYITIATTEQDVTTYAWEKIGSTEIDLSGYYTSQQTDAAITTALNTALADYSTTQQMTAAISAAVGGKQNIITDGSVIGLGYAVCSTAAATPAKEVTIANFLLMKNMPITIKFSNAITVANATMNISMTGEKPLYMDGTALNPYVVRAGMTATIIYDGTNYNIVHLGYVKNTLSSHIVDMGLPSGTLWADRNIDITQSDGFAASEFQYECSFFSWGNIAGHNPISDSAFSYDFGPNNSGPYASTPGSQLTGDVPATATYDIARNLLGDPWQLPSDDDFVELIAGCDFVQADGSTVIDAGTANKLVTVNGIVGIYLKSKTNGNRLFFPCSGNGSGTTWYSRGSIGYYWSGSLASATSGLLLYFYSGGVYPQYSYNRFYGFTGRAVQKVV